MNELSDQEEFKVQSKIADGRRKIDLRRPIEEQTSRVPSSLFLGLAFGSMAVSAVFITKW
jgi:hypothetical protein